MKGQKFSVVREFRPCLSSLHFRPIGVCQSQKDRGREGWGEERGAGGERERGGGTDERNDSRRQRRGEGLTYPSLPRQQKAKLLLPPPCTEAEMKGKRKRGKMEGLKVRVGGRKVFGDMETEVCVVCRCLAAFFTPAFC